MRSRAGIQTTLMAVGSLVVLVIIIVTCIALTSSGVVSQSSVSHTASGWGSNTTVYATVNQSSSDSNCAEYGSVGGGPQFCVCVWAGTAKMIGFSSYLRVAISPSPKLGQKICLYAAVTLGSPAPPVMIFTVANSTGTVVYRTYCNSSGPTVGTCSDSWDTSKTYQGINAIPGGYVLFLSTTPNLNQTGIQGVPFTLG